MLHVENVCEFSVMLKVCSKYSGFLFVFTYSITDHVKLVADGTHVAYTTKPFPMHTDLAYKGRPPGVG